MTINNKNMNENKSGIGSIIGTIIIIAIIILGGLYFWGRRVEESKSKENLVSDTTSPTSSAEISEAATIKAVTSGDDLDSIDADLQSTNLDNLDTEVQ